MSRFVPDPSRLIFHSFPRNRAPLRSSPSLLFLLPFLRLHAATVVSPYTPNFLVFVLEPDYRRDFLLYDLLRLSGELSRPPVDEKLPDTSSTILVKSPSLSLHLSIYLFLVKISFSAQLQSATYPAAIILQGASARARLKVVCSHDSVRYVRRIQSRSLDSSERVAVAVFPSQTDRPLTLER